LEWALTAGHKECSAFLTEVQLDEKEDKGRDDNDDEGKKEGEGPVRRALLERRESDQYRLSSKPDRW
jgi:hypothetical protein